LFVFIAFSFLRLLSDQKVSRLRLLVAQLSVPACLSAAQKQTLEKFISLLGKYLRIKKNLDTYCHT